MSQEVDGTRAPWYKSSDPFEISSVTVKVTPEELRRRVEAFLAREKVIEEHCQKTGMSKENAEAFILGQFLERAANREDQKRLSVPFGSFALDYEDEKILRQLAERCPRLLTVGQIAGPTYLAEKTVRARLTALIKEGLAERPRGPKRGATITKKGQELLKRLPTSK
jgi:DNA-binding MarR family transcriptional regulator